MTEIEHDRGRETLEAVEKALRTAGDRLSATWNPQEWQEDPRFIAAIDLIAMERKRDALKALASIYEATPAHLFARAHLFEPGIELNELDVITAHAEWALSFHAQHTGPEAAAETYRSVRLTLPTLEWSERSLLTALRAGEKARDNRVVVDSGRMLLAKFKDSRALPRALLACADMQLREGRPDLADNTLRNLLARYPLDPLVSDAERRLAEVQRQLAERQELAARQQREREVLLERQQRIERQMQAHLQRELRQQEDLEGQQALEEYQQLEREQFAEQLRAEQQLALEAYQRLEEQQALENQHLIEQQRQHDLVDDEPLPPHTPEQAAHEPQAAPHPSSVRPQPSEPVRVTAPPSTEQATPEPHWTESRPLAEELAQLAHTHVLSSEDLAAAEARARRYRMFPATLRPMRVVCPETPE